MKILYGVQSDGMGHAMRSLVVAQYLQKQGHRVHIVTSGKAVWLFRKHGFLVQEVTGLSFYYRNNKVSYLMTGIKSVFNSPNVIAKCIVPLTKIIFKFKPDVIFTDFELFTAKAGLLMDIPVISIDNISLLFLTKLPYSLDTLTEYSIARFTAQGFIRWAQHYCVTTFFPAELRDPKKYTQRVTFVPPIIRDEIIGAEVTTGNHILVYQTTQTNQKLIPALHGCPEETFIFYGCDREKQDKNVFYKKFCTETFITDFASAKAVITNGGFTLISEAIYLHKPIFCNPIEKHYEQFLNAEMVTKLGYGATTSNISSQTIEDFLGQISSYQTNLNTYRQGGNEILFKRIDELLESIERKI